MLSHFELDDFWILRGKQLDLSMSLVMSEPLSLEEAASRSSGALCWLSSVETRYHKIYSIYKIISVKESILSTGTSQLLLPLSVMFTHQHLELTVFIFVGISYWIESPSTEIETQS